MTETLKPFCPRGAGTLVIANAVTVSAAAILPASDDSYVFYNSSATATVFIRVTSQNVATDPVYDPAVTTDMPIPPTAQIRLSFGLGRKSLKTIASAADGNLYVTPGTGH